MDLAKPINLNCRKPSLGWPAEGIGVKNKSPSSTSVSSSSSPQLGLCRVGGCRKCCRWRPRTSVTLFTMAASRPRFKIDVRINRDRGTRCRLDLRRFSAVQQKTYRFAPTAPATVLSGQRTNQSAASISTMWHFNCGGKGQIVLAHFHSGSSLSLASPARRIVAQYSVQNARACNRGPIGRTARRWVRDRHVVSAAAAIGGTMLVVAASS